jgi:hypothetical protein
MRKHLLAIAMAAIACGGAHAANLVTNGGFETGDLSGWTSEFWQIEPSDQAPLDPHTGAWFTFTGCPSSNCLSPTTGAFLAQDLATVAGQTYTLSFYLTNGNGPPNEFDVYWNGALLTQVANIGINYPGYTAYSMPVTATGSTTSLEFTGMQVIGFLGVDDISVTSAVPEPGTVVLMLGGLAGVVVARRFARRGGDC